MTDNPEARTRAAIERWFAAALAAVDPEQAVRRHLRCEGHTLFVDGQGVAVPGRLFVAAVGKAATAMARGTAAVCADLIDRGLIITKDGHLTGEVPAGFAGFEAAHPIPDVRGVAATEQLLNILRVLERGDVVIALLSGGGSALLESPLEALSTKDTAATTELLLRAGAPIQDLNAVRAPLSRVKGGGLRRAGNKARFVTLILSDVLGDDPRVIASGPTVRSDFTGEGALAILERYGVLDDVPERVRTALQTREDSADPSLFADDIVTIVGNNRAALDAFAAVAEAEGRRVSIMDEPAEGEAREAALAFVEACRQAPADVDVLVRGAETTVTVRGRGAGGRNTEFALAAALELARRGMRDWVIGSLATDGQDAMTGVAGAIASAETVSRARAAKVDPVKCLAMNDSLAVFKAGGGVVTTGPTGTNVNDILVGARLRL